MQIYLFYTHIHLNKRLLLLMLLSSVRVRSSIWAKILHPLFVQFATVNGQYIIYF